MVPILKIFMRRNSYVDTKWPGCILPSQKLKKTVLGYLFQLMLWSALGRNCGRDPRAGRWSLGLTFLCFMELSDFQTSGHVQCVSRRVSTQTNRCLANRDTVVVNIVSGRTFVNCPDHTWVSVHLSVTRDWGRTVTTHFTVNFPAPLVSLLCLCPSSVRGTMWMYGYSPLLNKNLHYQQSVQFN